MRSSSAASIDLCDIEESPSNPTMKSKKASMFACEAGEDGVTRRGIGSLDLDDEDEDIDGELEGERTQRIALGWKARYSFGGLGSVSAPALLSRAKTFAVTPKVCIFSDSPLCAPGR